MCMLAPLLSAVLAMLLTFIHFSVANKSKYMFHTLLHAQDSHTYDVSGFFKHQEWTLICSAANAVGVSKRQKPRDFG